MNFEVGYHSQYLSQIPVENMLSPILIISTYNYPIIGKYFQNQKQIIPIILFQGYSWGKGGFPLSRNFYVRTDVNLNWLYVRKLK